MIFCDLIDQLTRLYPTRHPMFIWGPPGIGKSALGRVVAEELEIGFCDFRATTLDPVDLRGLPYLTGDQTMDFAPMAELPRDGEGILFLDEMNTASPAVQAAAYQLVLDRRLGDYQLPDGWWVLAAGNRESDRAVTYRMPSALMNRMSHVELEPDLDNWVAWALRSGIRTEVIAFLRFRTEMLFEFDPNVSRDGANKGFPTPRSWQFVSTLLDHVSKDHRHELIQGTIGEAAAIEFMSFLSFCSQIPDPASILLDPDQAPVPANLSVQYALITAFSQLFTVDNLDRAKRYLDRLPPEMSTLGMHLAILRDRSVTQCNAYIEWSVQHQAVLN